MISCVFLADRGHLHSQPESVVADGDTLVLLINLPSLFGLTSLDLLDHKAIVSEFVSIRGPFLSGYEGHNGDN